jgi:hypothetical protein
MVQGQAFGEGRVITPLQPHSPCWEVPGIVITETAWRMQDGPRVDQLAGMESLQNSIPAKTILRIFWTRIILRKHPLCRLDPVIVEATS